MQQFDTAKTLDSSHLPIALPSDGGLPWYSLSSYDILMTFAATPRILFTKLLGNIKNAVISQTVSHDSSINKFIWILIKSLFQLTPLKLFLKWSQPSSEIAQDQGMCFVLSNIKTNHKSISWNIIVEHSAISQTFSFQQSIWKLSWSNTSL